MLPNEHILPSHLIGLLLILGGAALVIFIKKINKDIVNRKLEELTKGLNPREARIKVFEYVRDMPYRIVKEFVDPLAGPAKVVANNMGSCSPKHFLLGVMFKKLGIPVQYVSCSFSWKDIGIEYPPELKELAMKMPIDYHLALKAYIDGRWVLVDCTWPLSLKEVGLTVNDNWDGISDTKNAVTTIEETIQQSAVERVKYVSEKTSSYTREDILIRNKFIEKFNEWLNSLDKTSK